ncbi:Ni/Fe hydrogenase subunit gamma [Roseiconus nitratireducens]|uniref:Ni/Fe hydrogenase subunit gamma n=2 Tax=Roseiconus nitratireducens TaxID=2605748 RepID=A0A5M6DIN7_9BACT|nr:Ni/Fe hydrogenase subunit gamma [Roseiconus nitratireducens]
MRPTGQPWKTAAIRVVGIRVETSDVNSYEFQFLRDLDRSTYAASPGQFNMLYLPGVGEAAISISGDAARNDRLVHTVRHVGSVTSALNELPIGATLGMRGAFGSAWPIDTCVGNDLILVGGGIGLAPLRPVIYEVIRRRQAFGEVSVLIGARSPGDMLYRDEFEAWRRAGIDVQATVDRADGNWDGHIGVVTLLLDRLPIARPQETTLMTCGPQVMMQYAIQTALGRGLAKRRLWISMERHMNCAVGTCGHCQLGPWFICKDGPVLGYPSIERWMEVVDL